MAGTGVGAAAAVAAVGGAGAGTGDMSSVLPAMNQQFSKEIEDEANSYFQRIYNHPPHPTISIDEVLDMLKRFKDSPNKKERVGGSGRNCGGDRTGWVTQPETVVLAGQVR